MGSKVMNTLENTILEIGSVSCCEIRRSIKLIEIVQKNWIDTERGQRQRQRGTGQDIQKG